MTKENFKTEVERFRKSFKEEAIQLAEKSITLEKRGNVALLVFDQYQEKANKLSGANMLRIFELLMKVEDDKNYKALVAISRKPTIFIAGADIGEIRMFGKEGSATENLMKLQAVFTFLDYLSIPTIAAIHGACMGGGTEFSLSCDYRMCTDDPATKIALPEVMLGLIPGWGGTQRLPKLVGLEKALDMILTGKNIDARKAKKMGLVDKVVPVEYLEERALKWAEELAEGKGKPIPKKKELKETLLENLPGGKWVVIDQARKMVLAKTNGNYPAPLSALEVVKKTFGGDLEKGLKVEAEAFIELVTTPESKNLIEVFYLTERVKKDKGTDTNAKAQDVKRAGVLGAGVMGGGIAQLFAAKDIRVRMKDIQWDAIAKGYKAAEKVFHKKLERKRMTRFELENAMERIEGTTNFSGFKQLDLVVEAVVENMDVKKKVLAEVDALTKPECVLATNTSSLSVTEMAKATKNPKRVVGMHFFNPVDKMPLVEVIRGKESSDEAVATVFSLSKKLGKTPIVVKDSPGFVVNRILCPYLNEAAHLMTEGVPVLRLDEIAEKFGMPMGPCALLDEVGLDVAAKVSKVLYGAFGERLKPPAVINVIGDTGRLGKKSGSGIYVYEKGKRKEDPTLFETLKIKKGGSDLTDETIIKRLIYLMVNEAARCMEEGIVRDAADIDIGMIFGTGFAPFRGGLCRYADSVGAESIVADLEVLSKKFGDRFAPCQYLQQMAVNKKKFFN